MNYQRIEYYIPVFITFILAIYQVLSSFNIVPFFFNGQDIIVIMILFISIQFIFILRAIEKLSKRINTITKNNNLMTSMGEVEEIILPKITEKNYYNVFIGIQNYFKKVLEKQELIDKLLVVSSRITHSERVSLMFYNEKNDELYIYKTMGWDKDEIKLMKDTRIKPGEGIAGRVFIEQKPLIVNKTKGLEDFEHKEKYKSKSFVSYPLFSGEEIIGVLNLTEKKNGIYQEEELNMLKFALNEFSIISENLMIKEW